LYHTRIGDAGLENIENLTELTYLDVAASNVTDAGLSSLKRLPN
jgi:hypothetical protein